MGEVTRKRRCERGELKKRTAMGQVSTAIGRLDRDLENWEGGGSLDKAGVTDDRPAKRRSDARQGGTRNVSADGCTSRTVHQQARDGSCMYNFFFLFLFYSLRLPRDEREIGSQVWQSDQMAKGTCTSISAQHCPASILHTVR